MKIVFGAMAADLSSQLAEQGLQVRDTSSLYQRMADAITLLAVQGILTQADAQRARRRLLNRLAQVAIPITPPEAEEDDA